MTASIQTFIDFGPGLLVIGCLLATAVIVHRNGRRNLADARENLIRHHASEHVAEVIPGPWRPRPVREALNELGDAAGAPWFPWPTPLSSELPPPYAPADGGHDGEFRPTGGWAA